MTENYEHGEVKTGRITYQAILHNCGEGGEVSPESFVGSLVTNRNSSEVIGRIVSAARLGNWIIGTIEFDEGKMPRPDRDFPSFDIKPIPPPDSDVLAAVAAMPTVNDLLQSFRLP